MGITLADGQSHSRIGCGDENLDIRCAGGSEIKITEAIYARQNAGTCRNSRADYDEKPCSLPKEETYKGKKRLKFYKNTIILENFIDFS